MYTVALRLLGNRDEAFTGDIQETGFAYLLVFERWILNCPHAPPPYPSDIFHVPDLFSSMAFPPRPAGTADK